MSAAHKLTPNAEALTGLIFKAQMQARTLFVASSADTVLSPEDYADMIRGASEILEDLLSDASDHADKLCSDIFAVHPSVRAVMRAKAVQA